MRGILIPLCVAAACAATLTRAEDLQNCIKFGASGGEAQLTNICSERLNMMVCVDNLASARACDKALTDIVTLNPGGVERLSTYVSDGRGNVHWGICIYPTAPVDWKPGAEVICKKTCVMC